MQVFKGVILGVLGAVAAAAIPLAQTAFIQETVVLSIAVIIVFFLALIGLIRYQVSP